VPHERKAASGDHGAARVKTVLYVEDNPVNVCLVQAIFAPRQDVRLVIAPTGTRGLELVEQDRPNLILLDLNLPDMPGDAFVRALGGAAIPVIAISGDSLQEQRNRMKGLAIADFIPKPFDLDEFERVVNRFL
jgi:CheY-like chemotaxis protein